MRFARNIRTTAARQEIEICASISLHHPLNIELVVTTFRGAHRRLPLHAPPKKDRMCFPGVRSPQQDHIRVFNFTIRTGPAACSEYRRQTGDARGVSSPVAAIDIVRAHHAADEFLCRVVQFVSRLGATEHAKVPRIVLLDGFAERCSDAIHGFIPRSGTMRAVLAHQWLGQTGLRWSQHKISK
jgi:hypothetical protein